MVNFFQSARTAPAYMPRTGALRQGGASVPEWRHASQTRNERKGASANRRDCRAWAHADRVARKPVPKPERILRWVLRHLAAALRQACARGRREPGSCFRKCPAPVPGAPGGEPGTAAVKDSPSVRRTCLQHAGQRTTEPQGQVRLAECTVRAGSVGRWRPWLGQVRGPPFEDGTPTACFVRR